MQLIPQMEIHPPIYHASLSSKLSATELTVRELYELR